MKNIGQLIENEGRYEFRMTEMSLIVRGDHPEWVMEAASEIVATTAKNECESKVDELETLLEFEEATETDVSAAKFAMKERFEIVPQCVVSLGRVDYKWAAADGRVQRQDEFGDRPYKRIADMSLTRNDSFLDNDEGVDMASDTK
jgi:hypothetical protein